MKVFLLGDSQGVGLGPRLAERLRADGHATHLLARVGRGARYWMGSGRPTVRARLEAFAPDTLIAIFGTNDRPTPAFRRAAQIIASQLLPGAPCIWIGCPRYRNPARQRRADGLLAIVEELLGDHLVDSRPHTDFATVPRQPDGVHLRPKGLEVWCDRIYPRVRELIPPA